MRGIAALAVVAYHITTALTFPEHPAWAPVRNVLSFAGHGGPLGVTFFFVLSGFLITHRMLAERARTGRLHLGRFYLRRVLRIWPLYYASLLIGFLLLPLIMRALGHPFTEEASPLLHALFLSNYDMMLNKPPVAGMLGVQWSVAIEEQFYLLWPLLFLLIRRTELFAVAVFVIAVASQWWVNTATPHDDYFHLFGNLRYLGVGALLALLVFTREHWLRATLQRLPIGLRSAPILLGAPALFALYAWALDYPTRVALADAAMVLLFGWVILEQALNAGPGLRLGRVPSLTWLGVRSYGIYLLHMLALEIAQGLLDDDPHLILLTMALTLVLTFLFAHLSYRYVEAPFLRLKEKWV
ncbi:MAG: acyltransferase [Flavobacteriales bacterium]|nr:acyltransferase [Flavobacteriales bacterium]